MTKYFRMSLIEPFKGNSGVKFDKFMGKHLKELELSLQIGTSPLNMRCPQGIKLGQK